MARAEGRRHAENGVLHENARGGEHKNTQRNTRGSHSAHTKSITSLIYLIHEPGYRDHAPSGHIGTMSPYRHRAVTTLSRHLFQGGHTPLTSL